MIPFTKMHGIGNDFVVVDAVASNPLEGRDAAVLARAINDRRFGVGGDGLIVVDRPSDVFRMRMFNPDGSESEMCGNGVRCVARLLKERGHADSPQIALDTGAGRLTLDLLEDRRVRVDMGPARLTRGAIGMTGAPDERFVDQPIAVGNTTLSGTAVGMGNPHLVLFVDDAGAVPLARLGAELEHHEAFPNRVNVHFVQVLDRSTLLQRTWERGAGATLACGTGACACAVAGFLTGRSDRRATLRLPGGELEIEYALDGRVLMTGPAETVFEGHWPFRPEPSG
ncbi:MAG: diaminopimelate epimerase [Fimbriimonadaceae bacterium]|nr:diaminopimelate epimerase [Fimbriimonadaceae bacterium]